MAPLAICWLAEVTVAVSVTALPATGGDGLEVRLVTELLM